jgi:LacI family transcriptional regulator
MTQATQNRVESFSRRALELTGKPASEIVASKLSEEGGYRAVARALKKGISCDGLYAVSDALALGAYHALKEHSIKIPQQTAVIGVGDYDIAPFFDPPLSCVGVSHRHLATEASRLLFQQIAGETSPAQIALPILENLRESSGHSHI